jgi:hypothetical protein
MQRQKKMHHSRNLRTLSFSNAAARQSSGGMTVSITETCGERVKIPLGILHFSTVACMLG